MSSGPVAAVVDPIADAVDPYVRRATSSLFSPRTQGVVVKLVVALFAFTAMIGAAVVAYAGFYYFYVPKVAHSAPVYLQYGQVRGRCSCAVAAAAVMMKRLTKLLSHDQGYDVTMDMYVPNSDRNYDIGNFMVRVDLVSDDNAIIHSSSRPAILTYQSPLLRLINTVARVFLLVPGWSMEAQALTLRLMEGVSDSYDAPITHAIVTISDARLMVYEANLHLRAHFKGLRYLMYYWSVPTGIVFVGTFVLWSLLFAAIAWRSLAQWWNARAANAYETAIGFGEDEGLDAGAAALRRPLDSATVTSEPSDVFGTETGYDSDDLGASSSRPTASVAATGDLHGDQLVPDVSIPHSEGPSSFSYMDDDDILDKAGEGPSANIRRRQV
ncbi:putative adipose-regulatory protein-domain-containing protein [Thamnocephalis sphaerospora]|uniref:Putative adipose-regulatory protein-domain-containing protein n=1 Tax=Thamnocephalis sphaerospora TaxID=78915 RepID=A0A4P9XT36_9FUNG|nr:putative adipose-regulatory protein-domain-containing protein [Thamnocephalis sphaerospora]|eukprot:RKP09328.1 putative adipose-regulatory protein-domain-containing protein [Thamnocephalis sphaerospora]